MGEDRNRLNYIAYCRTGCLVLKGVAKHLTVLAETEPSSIKVMFPNALMTIEHIQKDKKMFKFE